MWIFLRFRRPEGLRPSETLFLSEQSPEGHAEQYQYSEYHSGGVGIDKAGLGFTHLRGNRADQFGRAVDDTVVDNGGIADFPEESTQCACAFGKKR